MNESAGTSFGSLGRKAVAWVIILAIAVLALKIVIGIVTGLVMTLVWVVAGFAIVLAVLWAVRHL